jgi:hypothetical protein
MFFQLQNTEILSITFYYMGFITEEANEIQLHPNNMNDRIACLEVMEPLFHSLKEQRASP